MQKQLRYEEQQRKLINELINDQYHQDIILMQKVTSHDGEDEEDDNDVGLLSEWRKETHDR
jgi:hypothetical protein